MASAIRSSAPGIEGLTPREMPLPPQCSAEHPYAHGPPHDTVEGRKTAWTERLCVMADSAMKLLDPRSAKAYLARPFDIDNAISALYKCLHTHGMINALTLSAQQCRHLATSEDPSLPLPPAYSWSKDGPKRRFHAVLGAPPRCG